MTELPRKRIGSPFLQTTRHLSHEQDFAIIFEKNKHLFGLSTK